jgi:DNA-binding MarR family transcriptional regulator
MPHKRLRRKAEAASPGEKPHGSTVLCRHNTLPPRYYGDITFTMQQQALSAIVAWVRLEQAIQSFNQSLRREFGITGLQLAVLRILGERPALPLAALRKSLVMHPATLGQSIDELRTMGLCTVTRDARDKRARIVAITEAGRELMARAPVAGPVRLRAMDHDVQKLERLKLAFDDAVELFGLGQHLPGKMEKRQ